MKALLTLSPLLFSIVLNAQTVPSSIATWKNNAKGAYNIIHDDFGDYTVIGINNYADTMNFNRGLKFTFGAISNSCEGNPGMYAKANTMISHGHEIISHSHTHSCAVQNQNCGGTGTNYGWSEIATDKMNIEIDTSTKSILRNTGIQPRFFIYPYDQFSTNAETYLKSKGYIGSRTGSYNNAGINTFQPDANGFFQTAFVVDVQNVSSQWLSVNHNTWVDYAIDNQAWVNREMHNIGTSGWGRISLTDYRDHLDYVKSKVVSGDLWVGTISEILTYQIQKLNYVPSSSYNSSNQTITVSWNSPSFNVASYLAPLQFKSPVTLNINVASVPGIYKVFQNGQELTDWQKNGTIISVNVYPHQGEVKLVETTCHTVCFLTNPVGTTVNEGNNFALSGTATGSGTISYKWHRNGTEITTATSYMYTVPSASIADTGRYFLVATNGLHTATSSVAIVRVNVQTPYAGIRTLIPGKIEAENYDVGGQNLAFNETSPTNEGDGGAYRSGPVDIEICSDGGYSVGYITTGEWLEYSVTVSMTGIYDFQFRIAANNGGQPQGKLRLDLDGNNLIPAQTLPYTGGWGTWQTIDYTQVNLVAGDHILRLYATVGNFNINYINTNLVQVITAADDFPAMSTKKLHVFPVPAEDRLQIDLSGTEEYVYKVMSATGIVLFTGRLHSSQPEIQVKDLPTGVYHLQLTGNQTNHHVSFVKN